MFEKKNGRLSRRSFLKWSSALAGTTAIGASSGLVTEAAAAEKAEEGRWIPGSCWHSCGGKCVNKAYVVDGIIVRQKTDDSHPDTVDYPQQRGCPKGRSMRQWVLGADRLKYPMKRKHWAPGGGDVSLRGRDEWVRISWKEALDLVAAEFDRIKKNYGNRAFVAPGLIDTRGDGFATGWFLNAFGGCTTLWGQQSRGAFALPANMMKGDFTAGAMESSDRIAIRKSKLIVLWGGNPAWSCGGNPTYYYTLAKKAGAKIIVVDPWFSPTSQAIADQWIPVRPGTDGALLEAIAYHMITNNLQNQKFIDKYMLGFDSEHMPKGAEGKENFKDYILGKYDGKPKTPEWAAAICGTPAEMIRDLATQMATTKPMAMKCSQAPARTYNGANFVQLYYTIGWMTGNIGVLGGEVSAGASLPQSPFGGPALVASKNPVKMPENNACTNVRGGGTLQMGIYDPNKYYGVAYAEFYDAIITGECNDFVHGRRKVDLKCYCKLNEGAALNQLVGSTRGIEAFRTPGKMEFVVSADFFMTTDCLYSDIVLPVTTLWERDGDSPRSANRELLIYGDKVIEPLFEAKDDWWIERELAKRLDVDINLLLPMSDKQRGLLRLMNATVAKSDGSGMENLAAVTEKDIQALGIKATPHAGRVPIMKLIENGGYQVQRKENDPFVFTAYAAYVKDPVANPLKTRSGKFEIYCEALTEAMAKFNTTPIDPLPKYIPAVEGYEESFANWESKAKGEFPFQVVSIHHIRQAHSVYSNVRSLNELFANNLMINPIDAQNVGLKDGETALISNPHGKILRRINVTPRVMPGVVILGQGNWTDIDEKTGIDMGGNINTITGRHLVGEGVSAYNTVLVKIEKWGGVPVAPDYKRPLRVFN